MISAAVAAADECYE